MRVLFLTLEFADPIFSGNGVWARSLVRGLLRADETLRLTTLCGQPAWAAAAADWPERQAAEWGSRLTIHPVLLPSWGRLDRASSWEAYAQGAAAALRSLGPDFDLVMGLDWHSLVALRALEAAGLRQLPYAFLNVRVFSENPGLDEGDRLFYAELEAACVARAACVLAQTQRDVNILGRLGAGASASLRGLHCPLREDLRALAEPASSAASAESAERRYLLCVARLSPEKNVEAYVALVEALAPILASTGTVPLLVGAPSDPPAYGEALVQRLRGAHAAAEYRGFGPPEQLAEIYRRTKLNFHPALAEPFGMSIVEAAAFGAPTAFNAGGSIGAGERLRAEEGEAFALHMQDPSAVASRIGELLARPESLAEVARRGQARALAWSEADFAAAVLRELREAALAARPDQGGGAGAKAPGEL